MTMEIRPVPGLGQTVWYALTPLDVRVITDQRARAEQAATQPPYIVGPSGAEVRRGDLFAAVVVKVHALDGPVSLKVLLDGTDTHWVQYVEQGTTEGHWSWPDI